jgi:hypothetical protein
LSLVTGTIQAQERKYVHFETLQPEFFWLRFLCLVLFGTIGAVPQLHGQGSGTEHEEFDEYRVRIETLWFDAKPSGTLQGTTGRGFFDFQRDVHFNSYTSFTGVVDWRVTRKNHILFGFIPFDRTKHFTLNRTITFQGQTYNVGLNASAQLKTNAYALAYQYDILRRRRGNLGIRAQIDLFDIQGTLSSAAQITNGTLHVSQRSQGSLRAPLPVAGPTGRLYLIPNSSRLFLTGQLLGMYFFGYGNFLSTFDTLGFTVNRHFGIRGGYQLAQRLTIKAKSNRIGLDLVQRGPVAGFEFSF